MRRRFRSCAVLSVIPALAVPVLLIAPHAARTQPPAPAAKQGLVLKNITL